jgi:hypothetical protein
MPSEKETLQDPIRVAMTRAETKEKWEWGGTGEDLAGDGWRTERNLPGTKEIAGRRGSRVYGRGGGGATFLRLQLLPG